MLHEHGSLYIASRFSFSFFWLYTQLYIHRKQCFSALQKKEILPYVTECMNESEGCYAKSKKLVTEEKVLHDFSYMNYLK